MIQPYLFPAITKRHLLYHIMPVINSGVWQRNVAMIMKRMDLFNGTRAVAIVTGDGLEDPEKVKRAFRDRVSEWIVLPNDPFKREVLTFMPLWSKVAKERGPEDATFFAHTKGVTKPVNPGVTVHTWGQMMYEINLDYWTYTDKMLQNYPVVGAFKKVGYGFVGSKSSWHYSGSFHWFRNAELFKKPWPRIDSAWWGIESYPALHFGPQESGCLFYEGRVPELNLYEMSYMREKVLPKYELWRTEHEHERTAWNSIKISNKD